MPPGKQASRGPYRDGLYRWKSLIPLRSDLGFDGDLLCRLLFGFCSDAQCAVERGGRTIEFAGEFCSEQEVRVPQPSGSERYPVALLRIGGWDCVAELSAHLDPDYACPVERIHREGHRGHTAEPGE